VTKETYDISKPNLFLSVFVKPFQKNVIFREFATPRPRHCHDEADIVGWDHLSVIILSPPPPTAVAGFSTGNSTYKYITVGEERMERV
jgi:hypothetical protein